MTMSRTRRSALLGMAAVILLTACSGPSLRRSPQGSAQGQEVALYAMGLIGVGYRFGGKNPQAGFDCSGMVSYIYREAAALTVTGSAADMAKQGREIDKADLNPGDLVFFNTLNRPFSHVGVYLGDGRFIHAPSTNGKVRIARMDNVYFAKRFEMARSFFN